MTEYESGLLYYRQSGAINEAFSNIWGELIDLGNGAGNDSPIVRWLCGEDLSGGAIRMADGRFQLRVPGEFKTPEEIYGLVVGLHQGRPVYLKDVARVVDGSDFMEFQPRYGAATVCLQADIYGLDLMARAGFDPRESVQLWQNMAKAGGGQPPEFLSTHPSHGTRINGLNGHMPVALRLQARANQSGKRPDCRP